MADLNCHRNEHDGSTWYLGTYEELRAAGLLPEGTPPPTAPEVSGKGRRYPRWSDAYGRECSLTRWRPGRFRLRVAPAEDDRASLDRARRIEELRRTLATLSIEEDAWRESMIKPLQAGVFAMAAACSKTADGWQGPYALRDGDVADLAMHYKAMVRILSVAQLEYHGQERQHLKRMIAAQSDPCFQRFLAGALELEGNPGPDSPRGATNE